jgi:hypothetical protein
VALSLNLKVIAVDATHRYRAINTLTALTLVFMRCALVLMGAQNHRSIGAELFVVCGLSAAVFVKGYTKAISKSKGLRLSRIAWKPGTSCRADRCGVVFSRVPPGTLLSGRSNFSQHLLHDHGRLVAGHRRLRPEAVTVQIVLAVRICVVAMPSTAMPSNRSAGRRHLDS